MFFVERRIDGIWIHAPRTWSSTRDGAMRIRAAMARTGIPLSDTRIVKRIDGQSVVHTR